MGPEGENQNNQAEWYSKEELPDDMLELFTIEQQVLVAQANGKRKRKTPKQYDDDLQFNKPQLLTANEAKRRQAISKSMTR